MVNTSIQTYESLLNTEVDIKEWYFYHPASLCIVQTYQVAEDIKGVSYAVGRLLRLFRTHTYQAGTQGNQCTSTCGSVGAQLISQLIYNGF